MTVLCPKSACDGQEFATSADLAAHLIDAHLMPGMAALALARQAAGEVRQSGSTNGKETSMAPNSKANVTCRACGAKGHTARSRECPHRGSTPSQPPGRRAKKTTGTCGYCKRERPDHTAGCKLARPVGGATKPVTRRHPVPPKTPPRTGLVSEIAALGAVAEALTDLDATARLNVLGCVCKLLAIEPGTLAV